MDAEQLALPDAGFDVALCALGLMHLPDPDAALREMRRVLRPRGRAVLVVWGERARCGWAPLFGIVDAEVRSEVCPLFFGLGQGESLARRCATAGLHVTLQRRRSDALGYPDPTKLAPRLSPADRSRWPGRASTRRCANACKCSIWRRSRRGAKAGVTACRPST
jgi:SAM-dependent methyltransferase